MDAVSSFKMWIAEQLEEGSLVTSWDESLMGLGEEYMVDESEMDAVIQFAARLAQSLRRK